MESDDPDCHHDIPRLPKPQADEDQPDTGLDDPGDPVDPDDHDDPDDLPNIQQFIFTSPRARVDATPAMQIETEQEDDNQQKRGKIKCIAVLIVDIQLLLQAERELENLTYLRKRGKIGIEKDGE